MTHDDRVEIILDVLSEKRDEAARAYHAILARYENACQASNKGLMVALSQEVNRAMEARAIWALAFRTANDAAKSQEKAAD